MLLIFAILFFLILNIICGELFLRGFLSFYQNSRISPFIKGSSIIIIFTSLPIFIVSSFSSIDGFYEVAMGSAIGGNITNILIGIGVSSLVFTIKYEKNDIVLKFGMYYNTLLFLAFIIAIIITDGEIGFILSLFLLFSGVFFIIMHMMLQKDIVDIKTSNSLYLHKYSSLKSFIFLIIGIIGMFIFSKLLLITIINLSQAHGFSRKILASEIIGFGTRIPFLIICFIAAFKRQCQLLLYCIIESNIFLLGIIIGTSSLLSTIFDGKNITIPLSLLTLDLPFLTLSILVLFITYKIRIKFGRITGLLFIFIYLLYTLLQLNNV